MEHIVREYGLFGKTECCRGLEFLEFIPYVHTSKHDEIELIHFCELFIEDELYEKSLKYSTIYVVDLKTGVPACVIWHHGQEVYNSEIEAAICKGIEISPSSGWYGDTLESEEIGIFANLVGVDYGVLIEKIYGYYKCIRTEVKHNDNVL